MEKCEKQVENREKNGSKLAKQERNKNFVKKVKTETNYEKTKKRVSRQILLAKLPTL